MEIIPDLEKLSKKDLIKLIYELYQRLSLLEQENKRLRDQQEPPSKQLRLKFSIFRRRAKKPGQKAGHEGMTRAKPKRIDRVVEQTLERCPRCDKRLDPSIEITEHIQEDLIPAQIEVTCFKRHRYYCRGCQEIVSAPAREDEIPHGHLGARVLTQALILRYVHGLPFNKIQEYFQGFTGLKVSQGALAQALERVAKWLNVEAEELLKAIRASPWAHVDETGWKVSGTNHWLWAFVSDRLAYYRIERSRGSKVPKEVLKEDYSGVVVSDFHGAYNRLKSPQQKCWVHLLRELKDCALKEPSVQFYHAHKQLRRIFFDAKRLARLRTQLPALVVLRRQRLLEDRLLTWATTVYPLKVLQRLAGRVLKHHRSLLTFLQVPGLPCENNQAERCIRPHVILRNRFYQSRSSNGAMTHAKLMSLVHTLHLQGRTIGEFLMKAYLKHRQGDLNPLILSNH